MQPVSRRRFLTTTAGLAGILATGVPPARGQQRQISYLCWNNFAPASDKKLAEIGPRFTKDTGIKIKIDHIAAPQQAAKYASEVQTQSGHDIVEMRMHFPWLYEPQLVDLGDVVAEMEKKYGKVMASAAETARVKGTWRAVPQYHAQFMAAYREDLFKKASLKVPDTWEELYTVGKELKKMGNPVGIPISQNYDSISTAGPVLWSFGGMEVDKDGKLRYHGRIDENYDDLEGEGLAGPGVGDDAGHADAAVHRLDPLRATALVAVSARLRQHPTGDEQARAGIEAGG